jgi:murein DD-endopeptidase MepM/ murein hydrolase activator NlpD
MTGRMLLTALALASLTAMLVAVGSVVVVSAGGQTQAEPRAVRIRQLPPLASPTPVVTANAVTAQQYVLENGWEVTEIQRPTVTPTATPSPTPTQPPAPVAVSPEPGGPEPLFVGWPSGGKMTQGFGCSPFYSGIPGDTCAESAPWFHDGLDIANLEGAPVRAALNGVVVFAGPDTEGPVCGLYQGYGLSVIIDDGQGRQALYAHLSKIAVEVGRSVTPDTLIGAVGATGCTSGPHLHFGLQIDGQVVDPAPYIKDEGLS